MTDSQQTPLIAAIDDFWINARGSAFLWRFTVFTRMLLAVAFIPTGVVKLLGHRFTALSVETPVGAFFESMYQTGEYWQFLGACQVVAGVLLLIPFLAHWGAALFLPIGVNILVITLALEFTGTPIIVAMMLLAVIYLLAWDYHRFRSLFTMSPWRGDFKVAVFELDGFEKIGFAVFGSCLIFVFSGVRMLMPAAAVPWAMGLGTLAGMVVLGRYLWSTVARRRANV